MNTQPELMEEPISKFSNEDIAMAVSAVMGTLEGIVEGQFKPESSQQCGRFTEMLAHKMAEYILAEHAKGHTTY